MSVSAGVFPWAGRFASGGASSCLEGQAGLGMVGPGLPVRRVNFSFFPLSVWCLCIALSRPCQLSSLEPLWLTVPREQ